MKYKEFLQRRLLRIKQAKSHFPDKRIVLKFFVFQYQEKDEEVTGMKNIQIKSFELANFGKNSGEKNVKVEPLFNSDQSPPEVDQPGLI